MPPYRDRPYVPAKDPLGAIPPSRHPFQFWVLSALAFNGLTNFFAAGSEAVASTVDPFFHKVWALTLFVGTMCALIGAFWRDRVMGLLLERVGLVTMGVSTPVYGIAYAFQVGPSAIGPAIIMLSIGVASFWRVVHVNRELRILRGFMSRTGVRG